jgi:thioredoxin
MDSLGEMSVRPDELGALIARVGKPLIVEFWGPWCGMCRLMAPSLAKLRAEFGEAVEVVTLNVADGQDTAVAHNVASLPTLIAFRNGKEVKRIKGMISYANLLAEAQRLAS